MAIGLLTSMVSAAFVWLWQRGRNTRALHRKARLLGMRPGETCIVVMNHKWDRPGVAAHHDVQAMVEAVVLARELGCEVSMRVSGDFRDRGAQPPRQRGAALQRPTGLHGLRGGGGDLPVGPRAARARTRRQVPAAVGDAAGP
ncbi:hypothetical protein ABZZ80_35245 [Streptomyces sp. NPDC006356]